MCAGKWKFACLLACFAAFGAAQAADTASTPSTPEQAAKDKAVNASTTSAEKAKSGKETRAKSDNGKSAKGTPAMTAADPGLEVPSARNRPATAATPTTGTRGFKPKPAESDDKSSTGATTAAPTATGQAPAKK